MCSIKVLLGPGDAAPGFWVMPGGTGAVLGGQLSCRAGFKQTRAVL